MNRRGRNRGIRKVCGCAKSRWPKCPHPWHFNFKHNRIHYRFSLDIERGEHFASKIDAEKEAIRIRSSILAGTFERAEDRRAREQREREERTRAARADLASAVTLDGFAEIFVERVSKSSGKVSWRDDKSLLNSICERVARDGRRLGDWPLAAITEDELEAFYASLVSAGRAASTRNHYVQLLKAAFRWAAKKGYLPRSPISDDSSLVRNKHAQRARRVTREEESALLKAAHLIRRTTAVSLSGLIVGALETGCRLGELLAIQWRDVDLERRELRIRGENTKDGETRRLPFIEVDEGREARRRIAGGPPNDRLALSRSPARSRFALARGGLADSSREGDARPREHQPDGHVSQCRPARAARVHAALRRLALQICCKRAQHRPTAG